jgi:hypothetical protein
MPDSTSENSSWDFVYPVARLRDGRWSAQVDVSRPQLGLHQLALDGTPLDGQLLSVVPSDVSPWSPKVADAYVRGNDLVATYEPTADWPYAPQLDWRAEPADDVEGVIASLALLVSIQTSLLDTHPRIDVASCLPADEVLRVAIGDGEDVHVEAFLGGERTIHPRANVCCVLRRLPGGKLSYAELMPASDFRQLAVEYQPDGVCRTRWELFAEFLEKGVIRRARLQLALLDQDHDLELAAASGHGLKRRPLPLTT